MRTSLLAAALGFSLAACSGETPPPEAPPPAGEAEATTGEPALRPAPRDAFTYANYNEARVTHLHLDLDVNFEERVLDGTATLDFERARPDVETLVLDTNDLEISAVELHAGGAWAPADFTLGEDDPELGSRLDIALSQDADKVRIAYRTSPEASGLQWLSPEQTAGKTHPYMYSQNQTINARSMAPVQDTPAVRITYSARLRTPPELLAIMSAEQDDGPRDGDYEFSMPQPVPAYLLAVAVGDIQFKPISETIGVYAEEYILDAAVDEFADTPAMEDATVALYGPYRWGRYDLLVLPPSFPFGGMENPRLSFLTPTLVAGDRSLTNVVAHELAHSWSGNLVTNATWRDAWLNEGFTSYVENRIMETVYGRERAVMEQILDHDGLMRDIEAAARPELTRLKMPDDIESSGAGFSQVAYIKGQIFLRFLEERFGRDVFDPFLRSYFDRFAFEAVTTEDFLAYLDDNLRVGRPGVVTDEEIDDWVYGPGLPATAPLPVSDAFERVSAQQADWLAGDIAAEAIRTESWSAHEWLHFINTLPDDLGGERLAELDAAFSFTGAENAEIANAWYMKAIAMTYEPALPALADFLIAVGRGKFIYRLYAALDEHGRGDFARDVYAEARPGYHPIAQARIDAILK